MSATMQLDAAVTIAEFDAFVDRQDDPRPWELVDGRIVAMTNPTDIHEKIVENIGRGLLQAVDPRRCHVLFGGVRVQRSDNAKAGDKPRPDLIVRCGALTGRNYVTDPLVVVEVLSPSTMKLDRGKKLAFYKTLPTLRHVAVVHQDQMRIELHDCIQSGWESVTRTGPDDLLSFAAVGVEMTLRDAYLGLEF